MTRLLSAWRKRISATRMLPASLNVPRCCWTWDGRQRRRRRSRAPWTWTLTCQCTVRLRMRPVVCWRTPAGDSGAGCREYKVRDAVSKEETRKRSWVSTDPTVLRSSGLGEWFLGFIRSHFTAHHTAQHRQLRVYFFHQGSEPSRKSLSPQKESTTVPSWSPRLASASESGAGPRTTLPFLSYWEPWHGHMNLLAALFQGTTQPKWVHTAFTAKFSSLPSSEVMR
mmetsp:Transcript_493/g.1177  ORF Transcript_493/g.1177 Transcript_493/m.1177 type:complete len:225 (+) Transcript_493:494-1168(+)